MCQHILLLERKFCNCCEVISGECFYLLVIEIITSVLLFTLNHFLELSLII